MKKLTKSLLLGATLFSLVACGSSNSSSMGGLTAHESDVNAFAITVTHSDCVTVTAPSYAAMNTKVDFTVNYDASEVRLLEVTVSGDLPISEDGVNFSFLMPEAEVNIDVKAEYIDPTHGKFHIINGSLDYGVVLLGEDYVAPGKLANVKVAFAYDSPYSFTGEVTASTEAGDVEVTDNGNDSFSFVMPEADVTFVAVCEANTYRLEVPNSFRNDFMSSYRPEFKVNGEWQTNRDYEYGDTSNFFFSYFGEEIRVPLKETSGTLLVEGVKVNGKLGYTQSFDRNEDGYAYFTMPVGDASLEGFGSPNYKSVTVTGSDHLNVTLALKNSEGGYDAISDLTQVLPTQVIYVQVTPTEDNDDEFGLNALTVAYNDGQDTVSVTTDNAGSLYHFTMPNADDLTVSITEKSMGAFKGYPFVGGSYVGANWYTGNSWKEVEGTSLTYSFTCASDGSIVYKTSTSSSAITKTVESATSLTGDGIITTTDGVKILYSDKFVLGHYQLNASSYYSYDNSFNQDYGVLMRLPEGKTKNDFKFYYAISSDKSFIAIQAFEKVNGQEVEYANFFFNSTTKDFWGTGLSFQFTSGDHVNSNTACYNLMVNGEKVGSVKNGAFKDTIVRYNTLTLNGSDHYDINAFYINEEGGYDAIVDLTNVIVDEDIYLQVTRNTAEGNENEFSLEGVTVVGSTGSSVTVSTDTAGSLYHFTMPNDAVTASVSEKSLVKFKDYPFVGSYSGGNLYNIGHTTYPSSSYQSMTSYTLTASADGSLNYKGTKYTIDSATSATGDGIATLTNGYQFAYSDKFAFCRYSMNSSSTLNNAFGKDWAVMVKPAEGGNVSNYSFVYSIGSNKDYIAVVAYDDNLDLYACMFFDAVNKEFYSTGVTFSGSVNSDSQTFDVLVNGSVIGSVNNASYTKA